MAEESPWRTATALLDATSRICPKHPSVFLCSPHLAFFSMSFQRVRGCIHTIVLTQTQLGRNPVLFYQISIRSIICQYQSRLFPMCLLASLSVDEIRLPMYVNWSINFRGIPLEVAMVPSCLKHLNHFICVHIEVSTSCCMLQAICNKDSAWAGILARSARWSA